ncbi:glycosyltransferase family 4 protein [Flagellimonas sp. S3867]|uniref:glycosyltransferase n=1 Tax=Flagellimonas sp. S3867 TaxID=2768063 RepID=UPI0016873FE4|nr:glycosyltransferase family 4 protein [Flagellimonas sp. S3867]
MKNLLIIGYVWPEPNTTAAGHRMLQLIYALKTFGYQITFGSASVKTEFSSDLDALGVNCVSLKLNHHSFDDFVKQVDPAIVVFDRFMVEEQFGWRVAEFAPNAIRILNTEDLHSLRKTREDCHKKGIEWTTGTWLANDSTKREIASIYRSDLTLMVSTFEMDLLTEKLDVPNVIVMHLPFMLENVTKEQQKWPSYEGRQDFITYGNGKHAPNVDSIKYLKESIWPLIRKVLPQANLKIYGAYLPQQIQQMHNPKEGFHVLGWVENLDAEIQKARICLAPLRFGAGIKGKLVDAMRNGAPTVTTPIGAEGMHGKLPWNGSIVDDTVVFAEDAIALYQNKEQWEQAQSNAIRILNEFYNKTLLEERLRKTIEAMELDLPAHRNLNFIGQLLQHQTVGSAKYMAKWIEEKNRKK